MRRTPIRCARLALMKSLVKGCAMIAETGAVLITGATGGLGREFAAQYAAEGRDVVLVARSVAALDALAGEVRERFGVEASCFSCDLSETSAPRTLYEDVIGTGIQVEILVNNAGFAVDAPFAESDPVRQRGLVEVNIAALTELSRLFGADMAARGHGGILNVASVAAFMPGAYMATYYASKAYVLSFTHAVHAELRSRGVHVSALCPGPVDTPFWERADAGATLLARIGVPPARIVSAGRAALRRNAAKRVCGIAWKATTFAMRLVPRGLADEVAAHLQKHAAK